MTVHYLAVELYHWIKRLEELEKEHAALGPDTPLAEHNRLETEIFQARKSVQHYRQLLEGQKEKPKI